MLNLKRSPLQAEQKDQVENVTHFEDVFFEKNDTSAVFRIFRSERSICLG